MNIICISSLDKTRRDLYISSLSSFLSRDWKVLIINFDNNRKLEIKFGIEDYIIYDNLDYFSKNCDFDQGTIEINNNLLFMPSAYKTDKYTLTENDFNSIRDLKEFDYILINGVEDIANNLDELSYISDDILDENINYYINNLKINKKLNYKSVKQLEEKGIEILGELEISDTTEETKLDFLWEVFVGREKYIYVKKIIERIFNK